MASEIDPFSMLEVSLCVSEKEVTGLASLEVDGISKLSPPTNTMTGGHQGIETIGIADDSPLYVPLNLGWRRDVVLRCNNSHSKADIYYAPPHGKRCRSLKEVEKAIIGTDLTLKNFSFIRKILGANDPDKEFIRPAKDMTGFKRTSLEQPLEKVGPKKKAKTTPKHKKVKPKPESVDFEPDISGELIKLPIHDTFTPLDGIATLSADLENDLVEARTGVCSGPVIFSCSDCGFRTKTKNRLRSHMKNHVSMKDDNEKFISPANSVVNLESPENGDIPKPYSWLRRRYFSKKNAKQKSHIKSHTKLMNVKLDSESKKFDDLMNSGDPKFTMLTENVDDSGPDVNLMCHANHAEENGKTMSDGDNRLKKHDSPDSNTAPTKIFECFHCNHRTEALHLLKTHIQIHLSYIDDCGSHRNGTLNSNLNAHVKGLHHDTACAQIQPPIKRTNGLLVLPHACLYCDYRCGLLRDLREHVYIHTESKPFYCNICFYRSSTASLLKQHMSTHIGEKPYKCRKCDYKTAYRGSLMKHELRIHRNQYC